MPAGNGPAFNRDIPKMKLQIIVADDNSSMLGALVSALSAEFDVIATASDGRSALDSIQRLRPEVAVLDLNMPGLNAIEITREVARLHLESTVVICSIEDDPELIAAARQAGALGYVLKSRVKGGLQMAVKWASSGQPFVSVSDHEEDRAVRLQ